MRSDHLPRGRQRFVVAFRLAEDGAQVDAIPCLPRCGGNRLADQAHRLGGVTALQGDEAEQLQGLAVARRVLQRAPADRRRLVQPALLAQCGDLIERGR